MGAAVSLLAVAAGMVLIWSDGREIAGVDTMLAGLVLVVLGAAGALLAFLLWATGPRPRSGSGR
jgi:hypothetical protein